MSNRRVKSLGYDDDADIDEYEEDSYVEENEGLTADDKEQLRLGTIKVRELLGPSFSATDEEIQEALWHYYYDALKSVTYIKNKHNPTKSRPPKSSVNISPNSPSCSKSFTARDFFLDCPWFNVPSHRKGSILIEPLYPRTGLLGGSSNEGKMSKLAALAAKRRQKENAKPAASTSDSKTSTSGLSTAMVNLDIGKSATSEPKKQESPLMSHAFSPSSTRRTVESKTAPMPTDLEHISVDKEQIGSTETPLLAAAVRAAPSPFAKTILGPQDGNGRQRHKFLIASHDTEAEQFDFTEPSPDDIVTKAQTTKAASSKDPRQKGTGKTISNLNNGLSNLAIQEPVKIKSKNIDVVSEYKKVKRKNAANFVVIGHVDAGKSTLMGRLLFDLKAVDQRTMDRYKKEAERIGKGSFAFAWVLDQGSEERARGVTIDIATNKFETDKTSFTILDAPGHRDFVPNMIAGASQADFAVLVIDASTGNFESGLKGQTKEHALLVRSIGVQRVIVAVNKMDTADWSQDRFQEIKQQMSGFLSSAGFQPKNVTFVPCSGLEGGNILSRTTNSKASWYTGPTLVEELDASEPTIHALDKPLRMTVGDVFRGGVQNPLSVSGRIESGTIQAGEQIVVMPSGERAFIRTLEVDDEPVEWAVAGQNVVLNLTDIDAIHLKIGDVLCSPASPVKNVNSFTAKVLAFDHLTPMSVDVHRGRLHVEGRIGKLVAVLDKGSGAVTRKKPKMVKPGEVVRVVVELGTAVPLEGGARVVLRSGGDTIGAGIVE